LEYRVIIIESNPDILKELSNNLKQAPEFTIASTYENPNAALGQSSMYNPNLFIVDVENPEILKMIPAFVDIFPRAKILGTMSEWNADFAYKAAKGGALGCILKSFKPKEILESIEIYEKRGKVKPSRIITFFSPKGRSGKTTLASILALTIAEKTHESVAIIDADLQFGDMSMFFDVQADHSVVDAVHDINWLTPMMFLPYFHKIQENLYLLKSPDRPEYAELVEADKLVEIVRMAGNVFRYLFIDLPAGFNPLSISLSDFSNLNFVVAMINTGLEVEHMRRSLNLFEFQNYYDDITYSIFTRVNPCTAEKKLELEQKLGYRIAEIFPNEYNMVSVANSGRIAKGLPKNSLLMKNLDDLAEKIISEKI